MNSSFLIRGETRTPILCTSLVNFVCPIAVALTKIFLGSYIFGSGLVIEDFSAVAVSNNGPMLAGRLCSLISLSVVVCSRRQSDCSK